MNAELAEHDGDRRTKKRRRIDNDANHLDDEIDEEETMELAEALNELRDAFDGVLQAETTPNTGDDALDQPPHAARSSYLSLLELCT